MSRTNFNRRSLLLSAAAACVALPTLNACDKPGQQGVPKLSFNAVDITGAEYARKLSLKDVDGRQRDLAEFKGKVVFVFFGFTQCPDVCPTTMAELAGRGVCPEVVDDQWGRLTFADDLAAAIVHLLERDVRGIVHVTSGGEARSWADIARAVFAAHGRNPDDVTGVSTEAYGAGRALAPRPRHSTLDLSRLVASGFTPPDGDAALARWLGRPSASRSRGLRGAC